MFLVNSRSHLVTATPTSSESKFHHQQRRTFSRSYGTNLPSSFTRVFSSALGFSPHPPVSVYGTVPCYLKLRRFSWKHGISSFPIQRSVLSYLDIKSPDLPKLSAYMLSPGQPSPGYTYPSPSLHRSNTKYWNVNQFPIDYTFRSRLRGRLTLRRLTLRRKPWAFGVRVFHPHYRYSCQHSHF